MFKKIIGAMIFVVSASAFAESTPVGFWKSIDDETHKAKSIVEISEVNGKLEGKVVKLFREPTEDQNPLCEKCSGGKKDKPVLGLQIMWDLKKESSEEWNKGEILDPKNGKTYSCKIKLIENGEKLEVRGFLGFSLLGRTQTWVKAEKP